MMDNAIDISSDSSCESSDDEAPEPIRQEIKTTTSQPWIAARRTYPRRSSPTVNSHEKPADTNHVSHDTSSTTFHPGDSKQFTDSGDIVNSGSSNTSQPTDSKQFTGTGSAGNSGSSNVSGGDYEKLSSQQAQKRTLPPSFNAPHVPSRSANSVSRDTNHVSHGGATSSTTSWPAESKQSTGSGIVVNSGSSNVSGGDYEKLSSQRALKRTLPPSFNAPRVPSRSANSVSHGGATSCTTSQPGESKQSTGSGNVVNSGSSNVSGGDYENLSSQQALKRTLPSSFNVAPVTSRNACFISHENGSVDTNRVCRRGSTSSSASRPGVSKHFTGSGNTVNSRISNVSGGDYEKLSFQQALKRTLPPSFNVPPVPSRSANSLSHGIGSPFGSAYSRSAVGNKSTFGDHPAVSAVSNQSTFGDRYHGAHSELGTHRGISGVRILPPSMTHGTSASSLHYGTSSDSMHRIGIKEDMNSGNDERLIYQAALQDLNQPKTEADLNPGTLSVPLMRHQKIALAWMFQKETKSCHCRGGILADDQGLGKTVSVIALILKQKFESELKSKNSSIQDAEPLDLDADDESENATHESDSHAKPELKVLSNSETTGGYGESGSSYTEKAKNREVSTSNRTFNRKRPAAGTLIVCPASVVRQWARELDEKVSDESKLSVLVYHGSNRTKDPIELAEYDVVVTTYAIVTNEVPKQLLGDEDENDEKNLEKHGLASGFSNNKKRKFEGGTSKKIKKRGRKSIDDSSDPECGTLARVAWSRVVLDEAQTIKNHRTQVARACFTLKAKRRWCLSGTPIQNTIEDLYSCFRFLRYDPYAVYKSFCHSIKVPISRNSLHGYKKLQVVLRAIMLRRTKGTLLDGQPIINLPPKIINLSKVDFSVDERSFYRKLEADSRSKFKAYAAAGTLNQNYANILFMLLRLRQACDHPQLVKGCNSDPIGKGSKDAVKRLPREARISLLNRLKSSAAICCECTDPPESPVVTLCGHVFCYQCVSEYLTGDENMCPARRCKEKLGRDVVFSESTLRNCITEGSSSSQDIGVDTSIFLKSEFSSSKIKAVLNILQSLSKQGSPNSAQHGQMPSSSQPYDDDDVTIVEPVSLHSASPSQGPIKTIVFSQWTGMLDLVEMCFFKNSIECRRLDGTMSLGARDRAIKEFSNDPDVKVMLMSLKAGNLGLNMVAACHVILLDLWWNPSTEDQAIDRAHRIGQTRRVSITRITVKDTIEDKILRLQEEKRKMVASAFGEDHNGSSKLTVDELKYLFGVE